METKSRSNQGAEFAFKNDTTNRSCQTEEQKVINIIADSTWETDLAKT